jgi:aspartate aminotransferase
MKLADRMANAKPSATLALNAKAKALAAQGVDVVAFTAGEPDFDTPDHVKAAAEAAIRRGYTKYTPTGGIPELKAAIVDRFLADQGLTYTPSQILVSCGAKHSLYNLFQALLDPGDEVVIIAPYWVSYSEMVGLAGGSSVIVHTRADDDHAVDPDAIRRALTRRTRAIVINSPCNPTGAVLSRSNLAGIAGVLHDHDCLIVSDDIYQQLAYGGREALDILQVDPDLAPRTVVVNGCSKAYSMTGWRVGYAAGPSPLIAAMGMVQDQSTSNPTSIAQYAAVAALTGPTDQLSAMRAEFDTRRQVMLSRLRAIEGVRCSEPFGAFYAFPDVSALLGRHFAGMRVDSTTQLADLLLSEARLAVVPGEPFAAPGHLRLSFATSMPTIERGVKRLAEFAGALA